MALLKVKIEKAIKIKIGMVRINIWRLSYIIISVLGGIGKVSYKHHFS